jgi:hypothetical protein
MVITLRGLTGYLDDLRITKGVARYTATFNPPVSPHPTYAWADQIYDPYYLHTQLLMHFNGDNNSTAFVDSSISPKLITPTGAGITISTTQSKFGGTSAYFDGASYLTTPYLGSADVGTKNFTIECWVYITSDVLNVIYSNGSGPTNGVALSITFSSRTIKIDIGAFELTSSANVSLNTWTHIAATRDGTTVRIFKDGVVDSNVGTTSESGETTQEIRIGRGRGSSTHYFTGYMDDLRVTVGVARYTATFIAPTLPFADVKNLTVDNDLSSVALLMHFNGPNNGTSFIDYSPTPKTITRYGNTKHSVTQAKFGSTSAYFVGNGDYLQLENHLGLRFGTGDFTIEMWVYPPSAPGGDVGNDLSLFGTLTGSPNMFFLLKHSDLSPALWDGTTQSTSSIQCTANIWNHVAFSRKSNILKIFVNGVQGHSSTVSTNFSNYTNLRIGSQATSRKLNGYIDELRITKGIARYTANFTPSPQPFPDRNQISSIGSQINTLYQRTNKNFAWYKDGTHSDIELDPGVDGTTLMTLSDIGELRVLDTGQVAGRFAVIPNPRTLSSSIEIGWERTSSGYAFIDLIGDATYSDFGLRIVRNNGGSNTESQLIHRGAGAFEFIASEVAPITFRTSYTERMRLSSAGRLLIGTSTDDGVNLLQVNGNMAFIGTGRRIRADFSNATTTNRTIFQTSTSNSSTGIFFIPNGTGTGTYLMPSNNSDPNNCGILLLGCNIALTEIRSGKQGTGTVLPMIFSMDATEVMRITTDFKLGIGIQTPLSTLHIISNTDDVRGIIVDHISSDTNGAHIRLVKARGTASSRTVVSSGDTIGAVLYSGHVDPLYWTDSCRIRAIAAGNFTLSSNPGHLEISTTSINSTVATERMRITSEGRILIGTTTDDTINLLQVNGDMAFIGTGRRIRADFTNATRSSRTAFQTSTTNGGTSLPILPNGTATNASIWCANNSDPTNCCILSITCDINETRIAPSILGSGTLLPLIFYMHSTEVMRITTGGKLLIGTSTDDTINLLQVNGSIVQKPLSSVTPANNGELVFEATNNTTITVKYKGSDGTVRTGTIALT